MKRIPWFEAALAILALGIHLYAATSDAYNFPSNWFTRDDAYYYFKTAQNIAEGHGSTFDGLNPTNGYHPLWMLVCVPVFALARFDLILPLRVLLLIQGALSAATGILIYRLVRQTVSHPIAIAAGAWWVFDLYIHYTMYEMGLETGLAAFAVMLLMYRLWKLESQWRTRRLTRGQLAGLALAALIAVFSRLDLIFLALLAGAWIVLRGAPMRALLPIDALIAVFGVLVSFLSRISLPDYYTYSNAALLMITLSLGTKIPLFFFSWSLSAGLFIQPHGNPVENLPGSYDQFDPDRSWNVRGRGLDGRFFAQRPAVRPGDQLAGRDGRARDRPGVHAK
jgi:hypothetical protein